MIQANELRIGNCFINKHGEYERVSDIGVDVNEWDINTINPIPLSYEVFTDNIAITDVEAASNIKEEHAFAIKVNDRISLKWHKTRGVCRHIRNESSPLKHIEYLHQLQNLYFALTGEELTIQLRDTTQE